MILDHYPDIEISPYPSQPASPGKVGPTFRNSDVGSLTSHKNQLSKSALGRDLRFFVLLREE